MFLTGAVLDVKQSGSSQKYADVSAYLVKSFLWTWRKSTMKVPASSLIPNTCNFFEEDEICLAYVSAFWDCAEISCTFIF